MTSAGMLPLLHALERPSRAPPSESQHYSTAYKSSKKKVRSDSE